MLKKCLTVLFAIFILNGCFIEDKKIVPVDICYKGIKLGDNLTSVKSKFDFLQVNYEGGQNEYFSISNSQIKLDEGYLNPSVFLKFNENDELIHFYISFTYDGLKKNNQFGRRIFNELMKQNILCLEGKKVNGKYYLKHATVKTSFENEGFPSFKFEITSN